jgi:hypothetical protein
MGVERRNNGEKYGGILVTKAGEEIASLDCIPASVSVLFDGLTEAKREAGWCQDFGPKGGWERCD